MRLHHSREFGQPFDVLTWFDIRLTRIWGSFAGYRPAGGVSRPPAEVRMRNDEALASLTTFSTS